MTLESETGLTHPNFWHRFITFVGYYLLTVTFLMLITFLIVAVATTLTTSQY